MRVRVWVARVWVRVEVRVRMRVEVGVSVRFRVGVGLVSPSSACSALKTLGAARAPDVALVVAPSAAPSSWLALALRSESSSRRSSTYLLGARARALVRAIARYDGLVVVAPVLQLWEAIGLGFS